MSAVVWMVNDLVAGTIVGLLVAAIAACAFALSLLVAFPLILILGLS